MDAANFSHTIGANALRIPRGDLAQAARPRTGNAGHAPGEISIGAEIRRGTTGGSVRRRQPIYVGRSGAYRDPDAGYFRGRSAPSGTYFWCSVFRLIDRISCMVDRSRCRSIFASVCTSSTCSPGWLGLEALGRAAEDLFVAQPVVSAHLRSLENRLGGAELFYREGRQLHLTEAGRAVHAWTEDVLTRTRELERHLASLSDGSTGSVVMGASMSVGSYVLPHVLTSFRARHPGAALRLGISSTEHAIEETAVGRTGLRRRRNGAQPRTPWDGGRADRERRDRARHRSRRRAARGRDLSAGAWLPPVHRDS